MGGVPSKPDPTRELEVIDAGLSRTGTLSMQVALQKLLDGPVYYGGTQLLNGEDVLAKKWVQLYQAKHAGNKEQSLKYLSEITKGFVGTTDGPACVFVPELLEIYPNAKVVLVTRNPERWWQSFSPVLAHSRSPIMSLLAFFWPSLRWLPSLVRERPVWADDMLQKAGKPPGVYGPELIELHNDYIKGIVPKEKLLVMELKDGWGPLCEFLGKPVPNEPFPHTNDANATDMVARRVFIKLAFAWLGAFGLVGGGVYWGWKMWNA